MRALGSTIFLEAGSILGCNFRRKLIEPALKLEGEPASRQCHASAEKAAARAVNECDLATDQP